MINCMREMLKRLHLTSLQYKANTADQQPENQIKAIIDSNFDSSQVNKTAMRVWLDFGQPVCIAQSLHVYSALMIDACIRT